MSVHAPLSLPFVQLLLVGIFCWFERRQGKDIHTAWMALWGGLIITSVSDSYTYWTGLHDAAQSPLSVNLIAEHTLWAQIFLVLSFGSVVVCGVVAKVTRSSHSHRLHRFFWWGRGGLFVLSLAKTGVAGMVGHLGGLLVFGGG